MHTAIFSLLHELHGGERAVWRLTIYVCMLQPWLRVGDFGCSVLVVCAGPEHTADATSAAEALAASLWASRNSFLPGDSGGLLPHDEAVAKAAAHAAIPGGGLAVIGVSEALALACLLCRFNSTTAGGICRSIDATDDPLNVGV